VEAFFENPILTVREAAQVARCCEKTIYKLVRDGEIPSRRVGKKCIRIPRASLIDWLEGRE
jgi:excisionase family DNA binding protein